MERITRRGSSSAPVTFLRVTFWATTAAMCCPAGHPSPSP
jgi:hypothetical protein